jgi:hypothetical protein
MTGIANIIGKKSSKDVESNGERGSLAYGTGVSLGESDVSAFSPGGCPAVFDGPCGF